MIYPDIAQCSHRGGHASIWPKLVILNIFWTKWDGLDITRFFLFFFWFFPLKLVYFWTKSRKNIYGCFFHSFGDTELNFGTKNNGSMKLSTLKTLIFSRYWGSPLVQFSKFYNFLWACWFLCKNLSNFVPLPWKLHNPYCHTEGGGRGARAGD